MRARSNLEDHVRLTILITVAWLVLVAAPPLVWWLVNGTNNLF